MVFKMDKACKIKNRAAHAALNRLEICLVDDLESNDKKRIVATQNAIKNMKTFILLIESDPIIGNLAISVALWWNKLPGKLKDSSIIEFKNILKNKIDPRTHKKLNKYGITKPMIKWLVGISENKSKHMVLLNQKELETLDTMRIAALAICETEQEKDNIVKLIKKIRGI
jgi:hypothetical protein